MASTKIPHWKVLVVLLKKVAEEKDISQYEIARRIPGMQATNVNRFFACRNCPSMDLFLSIAQAIGVNFYFEDQESKIDFNVLFEQAMTELGRRPDKLPKN